MRKQKNSSKKRQKGMGTQGKKTDKNEQILGVTLFGTHKSEVLRKLGLQRKEMLHIATVNAEFVMEARRNIRFAKVLSNCYTTADSWGVVWGMRILDGVIVERVSGVEIVELILQRADQKGEKVFLLGAKAGVAEKAAFEMAKKYPEVKYGWYEGAKTVTVEKSEEASMTIAKINGFEPDYLLVAYGSPWQDIWIEDNRPYLRVRVAVGVGGTLDEWAGTAARCPAWLDRMGGKWVWRLLHEPWRWKRVIKVFQFGFLVLYHKLID